MNQKTIRFIKNFSYTVSSNLISLLISIIVILVVPKIIGVKEYGYWQLFLFYSSYVGFLNFGWNDGVYLRFGGKEYKDLDKDIFFSQFWMLFILQILLGILFSVFIFFGTSDPNKQFIFFMTVLCMLILNVRGILIYILQGTNRIKDFAQITILEKLMYCCLILLFLFIGIRNYKLLIVANVLGNLLSLAYAAYCCRDIVYRKISTFYFSFWETFENIRVGIKLMFANIASMFIVGFVRFGIERNWNVSTFGKVSLILSISNLLMLFINAISIIMFPVLRRTNFDKLSNVYVMMRNLLMILLLGVLIFFYPLRIILLTWLPHYADSFKYLAFVFPMCIYEGKMSLLINSYLKTLRKEKLILYINLASMMLSGILTFLFTVVFKNLSLAIAIIVVLLAFRCVLAELFLSRELNVSVYKDILLEFMMTIIFILTALLIPSYHGVLFYFGAYILYLFIKIGDIKYTFSNLKILLRRVN